MTGSDLAAGTVTGSPAGTRRGGDRCDQPAQRDGRVRRADLCADEHARPGTFGTIQINADGSYIYTLTTPFDTSPDANNSTNTEESGDSFTYTVTDANGNTATGTITVNIIDDVPTALRTPAT